MPFQVPFLPKPKPSAPSVAPAPAPGPTPGDPATGRRGMPRFLAGGTGDIAFRLARSGAEVTIADINPAMLEVGKEVGVYRR